MSLNPFIELARNPVASLAWLGYALLMVGIVLAAVPWAVRQGATLVVRYQKNRAGPKWWAFGDASHGYIPPLSWLARLFGVLFVLAIAAWALGGFVWLLM